MGSFRMRPKHYMLMLIVYSIERVEGFIWNCIYVTPQPNKVSLHCRLKCSKFRIYMEIQTERMICSRCVCVMHYADQTFSVYGLMKFGRFFFVFAANDKSKFNYNYTTSNCKFLFLSKALKN